MRTRPYLAVLAAGTLALGAAACGDDTSGAGGSTEPSSSGAASTTQDLSGQLSGAGASSQDAAQRAWAAGFQGEAPNVTVSYDPVGSGGGREQFVQGGVAFAGSDAALEDDELTQARERCQDVVEVPAYVSPIAVVYNLEGVDDLQLTPDTLAKIFKGDITTWNDPEIAQENPDAQLPSTRISPVHRSDDSGTTENFTDYLNQNAPDTWTDDPDGEWPLDGGESADGTSGIIQAVTAGNGSIGYADASQAGDLGVAAIQVGDQYAKPSPEAAAKILEESQRVEGGQQYEFAYELNRKPDSADTYPITLVSYLIGCTNYDDQSTAANVKAFFNYVVSQQGQEQAGQQAGSAPLSDALRQQIEPAINAIGG